MSTSQIALSDAGAEQRTQGIQRDLQILKRHDWSLWVLALVIILSLTGAVVSLTASVIPETSDPFFRFHISQSIRGLVGMVLLFSVYTLFQQVQLRQTRTRLAEQVEISGQQQIRAEEFLKLAMLDPLTGLHNRRYAQERLVAEISRAHRYKSCLTVLMLDLDDFKKLNDLYGHPMGDAALKIFAARLSAAIRGSDLAVRIGGDEFVVLLPECNPGQVQVVLGRLSPLKIEVEDKQIRFAFSAGWTEYQVGETPEQLLQRADNALYVEKKIRKNQLYPVA
jgi:diguanylate cyclase (GGDEF)-like protein